MSFLNSVLSSIETGDPTKYAPPPAPVRKTPQPSATPTSPTAGASNDVNSRDRTRSVSATSGIGAKRKPESGSHADEKQPKLARPSPDVATLRNVPRESQTSGASSKAKPVISKPTSTPKPLSTTTTTTTTKPLQPSSARASTPQAKTPSTTTPSSSLPASSRPASRPVSRPTSTAPAKPAAQPQAAAQPQSSKPPPKGSFAEIMARAKALQDNKPPPDIGLIKHQPKPKERLSKVQIKKRAEEMKKKEQEEAKARKLGGKVSRSNSAGSAGETREQRIERIRALRRSGAPEYKGTARPPPPPPEAPAYKGTARPPTERQLGAKAARGAPRRSRLDDYLATDEEDEGDDYGGEEDYYSESSDMEAGMTDVEQEEALALRFARKEDEEELKAEMAAKKEKLERKRKLQQLSRR